MRRTLGWIALALAGLLVAVALSVGVSSLSSQRIGLSSEPLSAGERLAPGGDPGEAPAETTPTETTPTETTPTGTTDTGTTATETETTETTETEPREVEPGDDDSGRGRGRGGDEDDD